MSEIKQINTGVSELLAVKTSAVMREFNIQNNSLFSLTSHVCKLPPGSWTPLGIDTELTEEQCRPLFKHKDGYGLSFELPPPNNRAAYFSAKEAFASLMQANGCYSVNPIPKPEFNGDYDKQWVSEYEEAEANTGTWLILKRLS